MSLRTAIMGMFANKEISALDTDSIRGAQSGARMSKPIVPYYLQRYEHPSQGLTPEKLASILIEREIGNPRRWYELLTDVLGKDGTISACCETRSNDVLTKAFEFVPLEMKGVNETKAAKQCEWIKEVFDHLSEAGNHLTGADASRYLSAYDLYKHLMWDTLYGVSAASLEWNKKDWIIEGARQFEARHFIFGDPRKAGSKEYNPYELRVKNMEGAPGAEYYGDPIEPLAFVVHYARTKPSLPNRFGLGDTIIYWYLFKNYGVRFAMTYAEFASMPIRWGKYDPSGDATGGSDKETMETALATMGGDLAIVTSKNADIQFIENKRDTEVHGQIWDRCNAEITIAILGHASLTQATPGQLGNKKEEQATQDIRVESDARSLQQTINSGMVYPMATFVDGAPLCQLKIRWEDPEDLNAKAERYHILKGIVPLSMAHIYETFEVPVPTKGEEVTDVSDDPLAALARTAAKQGAEKGAEKGASMNAHVGIEFRPHLHINAKKLNPKVKRAVSATRQAQAEKAQKSLLSLSDKSTKEAGAIYAQLMNDVNPYAKGADVYKQIMRNVPAFRRDMEKHLRENCIKAGNIGLSGLGLPEYAANSGNPRFNLKDDKAESFLKWQAFAASTVEGEKAGEELSKRINDGLQSAVADGMTRKEFVDSVMNAAGMSKMDSSRASTIYRTNLATAHNAGKMFGLAQHKKELPGWQFIAIDDANTTPECLELNGMTFANGDTGNFPPLHFNCRSIGSPISADEWTSEGYEPAQSIALDTEFENGAVRDFNSWVTSERGNATINGLLNSYED